MQFEYRNFGTAKDHGTMILKYFKTRGDSKGCGKIGRMGDKKGKGRGLPE